MRIKTIKTKKGIRWLIILMTLSLTGITAIQAYWIFNAYSIKEEKFEQAVTEALGGVSKRLEAIEAINFLNDSPNLEPFFNSNNLLINTYDSFDSLEKRKAAEQGLLFSMRINGDTSFMFKMDSNGLKVKAGIDLESKLPMMVDKVENKMFNLSKVYEKLMRHEARKRGRIEHRLMKKDLDSLIRFELETKGIIIPFEYAVMENNELAMKSEEWSPEKGQHKASLFPGDFFGNRLLMVSFPRKANYLLGTMWFTLLNSLLFTAAMIFTFSKTLSYSMKQKRISDIKTDFINNMTHEFKTPIATINLAIDAMSNEKIINNPEKIRHYSNVIKQENHRMNRQVESVLRMALMDKKELDLSYEKVKISEILDDCSNHIKLQLDARGGTLDQSYETKDLEMFVDKNHLANTIINILDNSMKYSIGAPEIKMLTEITQTEFILIISDKGIGMTKEEQKKIFDRFFRVSSGNIHNIKGHGLGLSYVRGIIEAHGGKIEVESEKNKGSRFYIYLPLNQES